VDRTSKIVAVALLLICQTNCGNAGGTRLSTAPELLYQLDSENTGLTENSLRFNIPDTRGYRFKISGEGFNSNIEKDTLYDPTSDVELTYTQEGEYTLNLQIVQQDDTPYLAEDLTWVYSTVAPDAPIVSFSEIATADTAITMQIADSRKLETKEIWIEGDLVSSPAGQWLSISESGLVTLTTTSADGLKEFKVKLRNIYGNESEYTEASIVKKSVGPTNCSAELPSLFSSSTSVSIKMSAENEGAMYYAVYGDVATISDYRLFTNGSLVPTITSLGVGKKNLTVRMRDAANSPCPDINLEVTIQNGHTALALAIEDEPYWTNSTAHDLLLNYDHYPSERPIEMKISGNVSGVNTGDWIDYSASVSINLTAASGLKTVFAQFRDAEGDESFLVSAQVILNPSVGITDSGGDKLIAVTNSKGVSSFTILGCSQSYVEVAYQSSFTCTPTAANADVTYIFKDDSTYNVVEAF